MNNKIHEFDSNDVIIERVEPLYQGFFNMVRYEFRHKLFAGGWSELVRREIFERGHAVAVLPYDPARQEFVLVEQVRIGALLTAQSPWLIEVIAGIIDEGETERDVVLREAHEEAGIHLSGVHKALSYLSSPGGTTERLHIFMAKTDASVAGGIHGLATESEDIRVRTVSEVQARQWLSEGVIDNAAAIIALQWFFLNKSLLFSIWEQDEHR